MGFVFMARQHGTGRLRAQTAFFALALAAVGCASSSSFVEPKGTAALASGGYRLPWVDLAVPPDFTFAGVQAHEGREILVFLSPRADRAARVLLPPLDWAGGDLPRPVVQGLNGSSWADILARSGFGVTSARGSERLLTDGEESFLVVPVFAQVESSATAERRGYELLGGSIVYRLGAVDQEPELVGFIQGLSLMAVSSSDGQRSWIAQVDESSILCVDELTPCTRRTILVSEEKLLEGARLLPPSDVDNAGAMEFARAAWRHYGQGAAELAVERFASTTETLPAGPRQPVAPAAPGAPAASTTDTFTSGPRIVAADRVGSEVWLWLRESYPPTPQCAHARERVSLRRAVPGVPTPATPVVTSCGPVERDQIRCSHAGCIVAAYSAEQDEAAGTVIARVTPNGEEPKIEVVSLAAAFGDDEAPTRMFPVAVLRADASAAVAVGFVGEGGVREYAVAILDAPPRIVRFPQPMRTLSNPRFAAAEPARGCIFLSERVAAPTLTVQPCFADEKISTKDASDANGPP